MKLFTPNKLVAIKPIEHAKDMGTRIKQGGMMVATQINKLVESQVVIATEDMNYEPGDTVYLAPNAGQLPWAQRVFDLGDLKFILVPTTDVLVVKTLAG